MNWRLCDGECECPVLCLSVCQVGAIRESVGAVLVLDWFQGPAPKNAPRRAACPIAA